MHGLLAGLQAHPSRPNKVSLSQEALEKAVSILANLGITEQGPIPFIRWSRVQLSKELKVTIRWRNDERLRLVSRRNERGAQLIREKTTDGVYPLAVIEERLRRRSQRHAQARFGGGHGS